MTTHGLVCPECKSTDVEEIGFEFGEYPEDTYECQKCAWIGDLKYFLEPKERLT